MIRPAGGGNWDFTCIAVEAGAFVRLYYCIYFKMVLVRASLKSQRIPQGTSIFLVATNKMGFHSAVARSGLGGEKNRCKQ